MLKKLGLVFFLSKTFIKWSIIKIRQDHAEHFENAKHDVFVFWIIDHFYVAFERKEVLFFFWSFEKNLTFKKCFVSP